VASTPADQEGTIAAKVREISARIDGELADFSKATWNKKSCISDAFDVTDTGEILARETEVPSETLDAILCSIISSRRKRRRSHSSVDEDSALRARAKVIAGVVVKARTHGQDATGALLQLATAKALGASDATALGSFAGVDLSQGTSERLASALALKSWRNRNSAFLDEESATLVVYDNFNPLRWRHHLRASTEFTRTVSTMTILRLPLGVKISTRACFTPGAAKLFTRIQEVFGDAIEDLSQSNASKEPPARKKRRTKRRAHVLRSGPTRLVGIPSVIDSNPTPGLHDFFADSFAGQSSCIIANRSILRYATRSTAVSLLMVDTEPALLLLKMILEGQDCDVLDRTALLPQVLHSEMKLAQDLVNSCQEASELILGGLYHLSHQEKFKSFVRAPLSKGAAETAVLEASAQSSLDSDENWEGVTGSATVQLKANHVKFSRLQQAMVIMDEAIRVVLTSEEARERVHHMKSGSVSEQRDYEALMLLRWQVSLFLDYCQGNAQPFYEALPLIAGIFSFHQRPNLARWAVFACASLQHLKSEARGAVLRLACARCKSINDLYIELMNSVLSRSLPSNSVITPDMIKNAVYR